MNKMTHEQFLLMKLAEEATEIAQIALKTAQFGMTEKHPDLPLNNLERIHLELNDLHAVVDELNTWCQFGFKPNHAAKINKIEKLNKYLGYSIQLGKVENVPAIFGESGTELPVIPNGYALVKKVPYAYIIKHKFWGHSSPTEIYPAIDFVGENGVDKEKLTVCIPLYQGNDEAIIKAKEA